MFLNKILLKIDIFQYELKLNYKKETKFPTKLGGLLTIIILSAFFYSIYYFG